MPDEPGEISKIQRRQFIRAVAGGALGVAAGGSGLLALAGCGSGGGSGATPPTSTATQLQPNVTMLPGDGRVTLSGVTDSSLVLQGQVPSLASGSVIVSSQGEGLLRKVISVAPAGGGVTVQTAQATLEDVFQQAEISFSQPVQVSDASAINVLMPGLVVTPIPAAGGSRGRFTDNPSLEFHFDFTKVTINSGGVDVSLGGRRASGLASSLPAISAYRGCITSGSSQHFRVRSILPPR